MKNEFVPYNIALTMKELGFDEKCLGVYYPDLTDNVEWIPSDMFNREAFIEKGFIKAPLYQQAFRWFREEHNIDCCIEKDRKNRYWFYITIKTLINKSSKFCYHRYEKAELACLRKLIEIVKEKQDEK